MRLRNGIAKSWRRSDRGASDISALFLEGGKSIIHGILRSNRMPSVVDEVWSMEFSKVREDYKFRIGSDAVPVVSASMHSVLTLK